VCCADCRQIIEKSIAVARNFTQSDSDQFSCAEVDCEPETTICVCPPRQGKLRNPSSPAVILIVFFITLYTH